MRWALRGGAGAVIAIRWLGRGGRCDASVVGHVPHQAREFALLVVAQGGGEIRVVRVGGLLCLGEQSVGATGQPERVRAAVVGVGMSLDELLVFKLVDEFDHLVAVRAHGVGELLLAGATVLSEVAEQFEVAGA